MNLLERILPWLAPFLAALLLVLLRRRQPKKRVPTSLRDFDPSRIEINDYYRIVLDTLSSPPDTVDSAY